MYAIGNEFDGNAIIDKYRLDGALMLIYPFLVYTRHCIVKMRGMGKTCLIAFLDILSITCRVGKGDEHTPETGKTCEISRSR